MAGASRGFMTFALAIFLTGALGACHEAPEKTTDNTAINSAENAADKTLDKTTDQTADKTNHPTAETPAEPPKEASKEPPKEAPLPLTPECADLLQRIEALDKAVPVIFVDLKRSADDINKDMIQAVELCRQFLKNCPGTAPSCEVKGILARMLMSRRSRFKEELNKAKLEAAEVQARFKAYESETIELASAVAKECEKGSKARISALRVLSEMYKNAFEFEKMRQAAAQLLEENPPDDIRMNVYPEVALAFISEGRYADAAKYMRQVIAEHSEDVDCIVYYIRLFDALTGMGDLEGMEELMQVLRAECPTRLPKLAPGLIRSQWDQWYYASYFWLGFVRMAQGDVDGAKKYFSDFVKEVNDIETKAETEGKSLDSVLRIYRDWRASHLLEFYDNYYGKVPDADFDLGDMWATEKHLTLKESRGKVVVVVFRRPGDTRGGPFLQEIDKIVKAREKDGLVGITLGFLTEKPDPEKDAQRVQEMVDDLKALGVSLPAGYDPDRTDHKIFTSMFATLGTASFAAFNRKGELVWWMADPRYIDVKIAERVIDRLLKE